jgi:carboxypeptidase Taq
MLLSWDQQVNMPPGGAEARAMQRATINRLYHEKFVSDEMGAALEAVQPELRGLDPDSDQVRMVARVRRDYEKLRKVTPEWVSEFSRVTSLAHQTWEKAREESDFAQFQPHLKEILGLRRQYADFFAPYDHVYDPLLDFFEPGMKTAQVKRVFDELRPQQVELVQAIGESGVEIDDSILHQDFDKQKQLDFGLEVVKRFGYDFERGRQDESVHPFTITFDIDDVRITTRVYPDFLNSALFGTMHEAGHAMYEQGVSKSLARTPVADGTSYAVHESQSRLWENLVGRSRPFWRAFYPDLQRHFPSALGEVGLEAFYQAINKVEPSLIRVEADEATYNLHIMLRFELELAMMEGDLEVNDLPEAWNSKMEDFLGLTPPDDAQGVLQDVHWSSGYIGYFPTYALGNLIASMLWEQIQEDLPDVESQIEGKEFEPLLGWLRAKVHQHGAKFLPVDLIRTVTGSDLTAEPYVQYLHRKFGALYGL